jgi:hypothetical protein
MFENDFSSPTERGTRPGIEALGKTIFLMWSILLKLPPSQPLRLRVGFLVLRRTTT